MTRKFIKDARRSRVGRFWFCERGVREIAIIAPLVAIAPIALGLDGAWIALHLIGGATALAILIYCCWKLEGGLRWFALAGVAISIATISVITGGGTIGPAVQVAMLIVLGSIYVLAVGKVTARA